MSRIVAWVGAYSTENKRRHPNLVGQRFTCQMDFPNDLFTRPVIECDCGDEVECHVFTNTCDNCGADYNSWGQLLAPRMQWGEETGEHWSECL